MEAAKYLRVVREVVVNVDGVAGVRLLERAGDGNSRAGRAGAAARDLHLGARDVELRDAGRPRVVDAKLLDAQQVLAGGKAVGDGHVVRRLEVPGRLAIGELLGFGQSTDLSEKMRSGGSTYSGSDVLDLEPRRAAVRRRGVVDLRHVERDGALVVHGDVGSESDGAASSDGDRASLAAILTTNIAAEVVGLEICTGREYPSSCEDFFDVPVTGELLFVFSLMF